MQKTEAIHLINDNQIEKVVKHLYSELKIVSTFIQQNSGSTQDAKDISQDAMVIFCQKIQQPDFKLSSDIKTYFVAISKNLWFAELRKRKKESSLNSIDDSVYDYDEETRFRKAETTFGKLSENCKNLLTDFYVLKLSMKDITKKWQIKSVKATKDRKYKCLSKARKMYQSLLT